MSDRVLKHVFGPVPSRRLGYSLGIDLVPFKVCSFDCIYCQLGNTTKKTTQIKEYFPFDEIISDVHDKLKENCRIDYLTLSGSGEPTLYSCIGEVIDELKKVSKPPVAVLTNGSMLWKNEVSQALMNADVVIPSLDAGNDEMFQYINRPCSELSFEQIVSGIKSFIEEFRGETWLEVFLLKGTSSEEKHIKELADIVKWLNPTKTQLNTIARPPCEKYAEGLSYNELESLCKYFPGQVEAVADFKESKEAKSCSIDRDVLINLLKRRPCTLKGISLSISVNCNEVIKTLQHLCAEGIVTQEELDGKRFYKIKGPNSL